MPNKEIKLRRLKIENYKAIDKLEIKFPAPSFSDEPDVMVIGSRNGVGKTSVLEACSLVFLGAAGGSAFFGSLPPPLNIFYKAIRSGKSEALIYGDLLIGSEKRALKMSLRHSNTGYVIDNGKRFESFVPYRLSGNLYNEEILSRIANSIMGISSDPFLLPPFYYFNSYRKTREGNPGMGMLVSGSDSHHYFKDGPFYESPISVFKLEIIKSMMAEKGLFEGLTENEPALTIDKLNELVRQYADGSIDKLRPANDNTFEFRVKPAKGGESYPFDGLSSGQKEIISTLFLIWKYTKDEPGIVLIDEPELHLNAEWRRSFIKNLFSMARNNQYIIATHSKDIFASGDENRRIMLSPSEGAKAR